MMFYIPSREKNLHVLPVPLSPPSLFSSFPLFLLPSSPPHLPVGALYEFKAILLDPFQTPISYDEQ